MTDIITGRILSKSVGQRIRKEMVMKKLFFIAVLSLSMFTFCFSEEIQTTFVTPKEPLVRITFNVPKNVEGAMKYYPMHIKLTGESITASGSKATVTIEKDIGDLSDITLTPSEIYAKIENTDIREVFAEFYETACGMNVKE